MYKVFDKWFFGYEKESHYLIFTCPSKEEAEIYIKEAVSAGRNKDDFYFVEQQRCK